MRLTTTAALIVLLQLGTPGCSDDDTPANDTSSGEQAPGDAGPDGDAGDPTLVVTTNGPVKGKVESGYRAFLSIPFAAPPIGDLRWKAPEPPQPWTAPHDATEYGASCVQAKNSIIVLDKLSEDCLTLAVWTPDPAPRKAPVMVWIHGGGFALGGAAVPGWAGYRLAEKHGMVVVAMNYRLGAMGQFAHAALGSGSGNFGLLDQQAALRWVKDNIAAFGGDPDNVTLFGESAGGISVCLHLASPKSKGLFQRGIMQSGACLKLPTRADAEAFGQQLATTVGCDTATSVSACLRGKTAEELVLAAPLPLLLHYDGRPLLLPFVDGDSLVEQPVDTLAAGSFNKVSVLLGSNANEGTLFLNGDEHKAMDDAKYQERIGYAFEAADAAKVIARYPSASYSTPRDALAEVVTDSIFACPTRRTARAVAAAGETVYLYQWVYAPSHYSLYPYLRASHGAELPFVFGIPATPLPFIAKEKPLVDTMTGYWARFASTGDPNGDGAVPWPRYDATSDKHLELDAEQQTEKNALKRDTCDFWRDLPL
ncbi:MAG: carboxylesterase family protein [Myxococcales bacterium]|nr:carboxylesterase family protein [Myxococcales bacterium]